MSDLLGIGLSGVKAYRGALAAIGENVANAETPGYSRRTVALRQANAGATQPDIHYRDQLQFSGVAIGGVQRAWDGFRATEARTATAAAGRSTTREQWLTAVETALEDGPTGVGGSLTSFYSAATNLAADPSDRLRRGALLSTLSDVASGFRTTAAALSRVADGVVQSAELEATAVNNALAALDNLNGTLRTAPAGTTARAALEDERDRLIGELAERIDVEPAFAADGTVSLSGSGGVLLLDRSSAATLSVSAAADGRLSLQATKNGVTALSPASGKLAGLVDVSNRVADQRAALDALATDVVATVNAWSAAGTDAGGAVGSDLLAIGTGFGAAATLATIPTDPARVATAGGGQPNGNLLALDGIRTGTDLEGRWSELVGTNGQVLASAKSEARAATSWRDQARASLDEVTGVDLDREAAELLRFQQAYSGSARILQVARETLQEIMNLF